jgi:hypothetical protein
MPGPGPARALVTIPYEVDAPPSILMLRRRQAFVDDVREKHLGEVISVRGGRGIMEVEIDVADAASAQRPLSMLLRDNGLEYMVIGYSALVGGNGAAMAPPAGLDIFESAAR